MLTPEQVSTLIAALEAPYSVMVLIAACLGLRIEEIVALQWTDFDFASRTVAIGRAFTHGELKDVKTESSAAKLPIPELLADALVKYKQSAVSRWLFPASRGDKPRWTGILFQDHIQPVAKKLGLPHIGWHAFRHSYRSWIGSGDAKLSEEKDLMRHSSQADDDVAYGGTQVESMRPHVDAVAAKVLMWNTIRGPRCLGASCRGRGGGCLRESFNEPT